MGTVGHVGSMQPKTARRLKYANLSEYYSFVPFAEESLLDKGLILFLIEVSKDQKLAVTSVKE